MTSLGIPIGGAYRITAGWIPGIHRAVDFAVPVGTPVLAAAGGTVTKTADNGAMGDTIFINHGSGWETRYGNITTYLVAPGDTVSAGQQIGTSGGARGSKDPGDSTGPHLPFQVLQNGSYVNPAPLLGVTMGTSGTSTQLASDVKTQPAGLISLQSLGINVPQNFLLRSGFIVIGATFLIIALTKLAAASDIGQATIQTGKQTLKSAGDVAAVVPK